ncbi:hypothetical protein [Desulfogranum japonicum]|uniref:hypothetical protein n=1 Tax=Desulfogranum japonicum TaxID=231447 RepID=UPI000416CC10|nr:hypothetical protein [Desulfogranum japonicum]
MPYARYLSALVLMGLVTVYAPLQSVADQIDQRPTEQHEMQEKSYSIPPELTPEELKWYVKFQEGGLLVDGWQDIAAGIIEKTPVTEKAAQEELLQALGYKIGLEWCKDNEIRKVDTSMLKEWGNKLKDTAKKNPENLDVVLLDINSELDSLLN